jgi:hypothetical protein
MGIVLPDPAERPLEQERLELELRAEIERLEQERLDLELDLELLEGDYE